MLDKKEIEEAVRDGIAKEKLKMKIQTEVDKKFNDPEIQKKFREAANLPSKGQETTSARALEAAINKINNKFKGAPMPLKGSTPSERLKEANDRTLNKCNGGA